MGSNFRFRHDSNGGITLCHFHFCQKWIFAKSGFYLVSRFYEKPFFIFNFFPKIRGSVKEHHE